MKFRANLVRLRNWLCSQKVRRFALLALIFIVLSRLSLLTYWSWDNLDSTRASRILLLMWGLGLIAVAILLRFLRGTYQSAAAENKQNKRLK